MRRLRIGIDFHSWDGIFQGSRSHILGLYREAIKAAPEIDFYFFLADTEGLKKQFSEFASSNVTLVHAPHIPSILRLTFQLPWLQFKHKISLLHMQYRLPLFRFGPCVCTIHDLLFETHPQFFSESFVLQSKITFRMAAKAAKVVFTVSEYSKAELVRLYGLEAANVHVTYNGVDRKRFYPGQDGIDVLEKYGLNSGDYILTVGRLEPRKNQASLINAWVKSATLLPKLVIVGQKDFSYEQILNAAKEANIADKLILLEHVSDAELPAIMRHCRIFAYPAFAEGFGMPVAEAMASGVPVITSNTTSLPEVAGEGAILIDPNSVEAIRTELLRIHADENLRQNLAKKALEQVEKFSWEQSAHTFLREIKKCVVKEQR